MTSPALSSITTRRATPADARLLAALAAATFSETFGRDNTPENMALYMASAFGESVQRAELADPRTIVFFAERDGETVGYTMLREGPAPDSVGAAAAVEIARLYAATHLIGAGVGTILMQRCIDEAGARGKHTLWLGVWERNARAIMFYARWGFTDVGSQDFMLGNDRQTDRLMARRVEEEG